MKMITRRISLRKNRRLKIQKLLLIQKCAASESPDGWWKNTAPPTGTHLIEYKEKDTKTRKLVGKEATELSADKYGASEWWLLLEPIS